MEQSTHTQYTLKTQPKGSIIMEYYWYTRVRFTSICLSDVPLEYRAGVKKRLDEQGLNSCGK